MEHINKLYQEGSSFEKNKNIDDRKAKGVFYTPLEIVGYMVRNTLSTMDIVKNPYVKILDISCGAGYFLLKAFEVLKLAFEEQFDNIISSHPELKNRLNYGEIGRFIVENNIWGADIDQEAVELVRCSLNKAAGCSCKSNIICGDSLLSSYSTIDGDAFWENEFDYIIGNPPYIGHKAVPNEYKILLYQHYSEVYRDKSDISYCFFQRGLELLKPGGTLSFITSRYFMEGPSAEKLRDFITSYFVEEVVDFGDCKVFDDVGVSVCILTIKKQQSHKKVRVRKIENFDKELGRIYIEQTKPFYIEKSYLRKEGWLLLKPDALEIFELIGSSATHELGEVFDSYQGIITGCDKAFVLTEQKAKELGIEQELLRPWIKNSHVEKFTIKPSDKLLIYSDLIKSPESYPKAIAFAEIYKEKLLQRRECQKGVRQWYQLQWGRSAKCFEDAKLVYPYKAAANRFAVDRQGFYCSADVYSLLLKENFKDRFSLEYIAALLNSKAMEFYFKCIAKKISPEFYDYYPNKVLKIKLKLNEVNKKIEELVDLLYKTQESAERKCILQAIDREIYKMYDLSECQIKIIENSAGE
jgi:adenine-specific DNA-methyltransferase